MAYIYQASIYCDEHGEKMCQSLREYGKAPIDEMDYSAYDSDNFPKHFNARGEESDSPQHCATCNEFIRNPLTSEGYEYVQSALNFFPECTSIGKLVDAGHLVLATWATWYNFRYFDNEDIADAMDAVRYPSVGWYSNEAY